MSASCPNCGAPLPDLEEELRRVEAERDAALKELGESVRVRELRAIADRWAASQQTL